MKQGLRVLGMLAIVATTAAGCAVDGDSLTADESNLDQRSTNKCSAEQGVKEQLTGATPSIVRAVNATLDRLNATLAGGDTVRRIDVDTVRYQAEGAPAVLYSRVTVDIAYGLADADADEPFSYLIEYAYDPNGRLVYEENEATFARAQKATKACTDRVMSRTNGGEDAPVAGPLAECNRSMGTYLNADFSYHSWTTCDVRDAGDACIFGTGSVLDCDSPLRAVEGSDVGIVCDQRD